MAAEATGLFEHWRGEGRVGRGGEAIMKCPRLERTILSILTSSDA